MCRVWKTVCVRVCVGVGDFPEVPHNIKSDIRNFRH